jgi:2-polyprenyl-3-methyl-5-hydroxy-6-metoxy-1,4-benzoquinol methylase
VDDTDYAFGRTQNEYERLIEQGELFRPLTERMLVAAGIRRGMHVLDIGCGVGDVSFLLADLVGSDSLVLGVDIDTECLKVAEERRLRMEIANIKFRQSVRDLLVRGEITFVDRGVSELKGIPGEWRLYAVERQG